MVSATLSSRSRFPSTMRAVALRCMAGLTRYSPHPYLMASGKQLSLVNEMVAAGEWRFPLGKSQVAASSVAAPAL